ncbi:MAG: hypothetical protein HAW67_06995 [Endozoicomonadaceae bacterium]|nr:hypothetical protein [Endozoicomonadaceae bacterium]
MSLLSFMGDKNIENLNLQTECNFDSLPQNKFIRAISEQMLSALDDTVIDAQQLSNDIVKAPQMFSDLVERNVSLQEDRARWQNELESGSALDMPTPNKKH